MSDNPQSDKPQNDIKPLVTSKLPRPITVTGTAYEDQIKDELPEEPEEEIEEVVQEDDSTLPMPVIFGDDDEPEVVESNEPAPLAQDTEKPEPEIGRPIIEVKEGAFEASPQDETGSTEFSQPVTTSSSESPTLDPEQVPQVQETTMPAEMVTEPQLELQQPPVTTFEPIPEVTAQTTIDTTNKMDTSLAPEPVPTDQAAQTENVNQTQDDFDIPALNSSQSQYSQQPPYTTQYPVDQNNSNSAIPSEVNTILHNQNQPRYQQPNPAYGQAPAYQYTSQSSSDSSGSSNVFTKVILGLVAMVVGGSVIVGGYLGVTKFMNNSSQEPQQAVSEPSVNSAINPPAPPINPVSSPSAGVTVSPSQPTPTPTPKPEIDRSEIKVKVLNGSGEKGIASKVKILLEDAGYEDVLTGNADNFNYTKTQIDYKPDLVDLIPEIQEALGTTYSAVTGDELKTSDSVDIYVIVGASKESSTKATPTPIASSTDEDE